MTTHNERQRYCEIRARCLHDILEMSERNIRNAGLTALDAIDAGDFTKSDEFYLNVIRGQWEDLREDVQDMLASNVAT